MQRNADGQQTLLRINLIQDSESILRSKFKLHCKLSSDLFFLIVHAQCVAIQILKNRTHILSLHFTFGSWLINKDHFLFLKRLHTCTYLPHALSCYKTSYKSFGFHSNCPECTASLLAKNFHLGASLSLTNFLLDLTQSHDHAISIDTADD